MVQDSFQVKRRITLVGALLNLALAGLKIMAGLFGNSQALVADGVHSLSDLISDLLVLYAAYLASHKPDFNHPYGHQRFETVATLALGLLLVGVACGFIVDAGRRLLDAETLLAPGWFVLPAALVSVLSKEVIYRYTLRAGRRLRSAMLEANAWHHRSDALSSVVVIVGVLGALAGYAWFDTLAAVVVALMIGLVGWKFIWNSLSELVDTGLRYEQVSELEQLIDSVAGVYSHHALRTRRMGSLVLLDVHIVVDAGISVAEGHCIGEMVRYSLLNKFSGRAEILIHVDPLEETGETDS